METLYKNSCTAFEGVHCIATGDLKQVALKSKARLDQSHDKNIPILIFDDTTSRIIEVDFRGTAEDVEQCILAMASASETTSPPQQEEPETPRSPGRPKLGVVAREVTLLPRHWDWLNEQPGGASVALRKLVEAAKRDNLGKDQIRQVQDATYRFMSAMAGDEPHFEEATRALYAGNEALFNEHIADWPVDIRNHVQKLASTAFSKV